MVENMFYVYVDYRQDTNCPFYVGKGKSDRIRKLTRNRLHTNIRNVHGMKRVIIFESSDESEAFEKEIEAIRAFGTFHEEGKGGANFTYGGEGVSGGSIPLETRRIISEKVKLLWEDSSYRDRITEKLREITTEFWADEKNKERMLILRKDPLVRAKISESVKKLWNNTDYREKTNLARSAVQKSEGFGSKISEGILKNLSAEQRSSKSSAVWANPKSREKLSLKMKEKWKDPDFRKKHVKNKEIEETCDIKNEAL